MAVFSEKIIDCCYSNPELTSVEILWEPDDPAYLEKGIEIMSHHLSVDEDDGQFQDLLKEWSYEQIDESTKARNAQYRDEFRRVLLKSEGRTGPDLVQGSLNMLFEFDPENNDHKDVLFKMKLKMFEQDAVKNSVKRKGKTEIRKAGTPVEAIKAYAAFF